MVFFLAIGFPPFISAVMLQLADFRVDDDASVLALLEKVFGWKEAVKVAPVSGGITNSLLMASNTRTNEKVLVRLYGKATGAIIDRDRELVAHEMLFHLDLASKLYAKFANGILYGFIQGSPLTYQDLPQWADPIAKHLFTIHSQLDTGAFRAKLAKDTLCEIWPILHSWVSQLDSEELQTELRWLEARLHNVSPPVACHSDLLAGNIITSENRSVSFIDYEYLMIAPRAFDIANHLMEWQGFVCERSRIPSADSEIVRNWCRSYLSLSSSDNVDILVDEVAAHYGLPGFFWGVWAQIQASISELDFDYASYSQLRLQEYWAWKNAL